MECFVDYVGIGERIRRVRKNRGWTQAGLAETVGGSTANITNIEKAKTKLSLNMVVRIADVLGVSIDEMFGRGGGRPALDQLLSEELDRAEQDENGLIPDSAEGEKRRMQAAWRICHLLACVYARCSNSSEVSRMTIEGSGM